MEATVGKHKDWTIVILRVAFCLFLVELSASLGCSQAGLSGGNGNSNSANDNSTDGDNDNDNGNTNDNGGPTGAPRVHRATATACPVQRGPGNFLSNVSESCGSDADCSDGVNGRCMAPLGGAADNVCTYDACSTDADCTNAVCDCRPDAISSAPNRCLIGNCKVDSDCGQGGYCSPSVAFDRVNYPYAGYYCRTAEDRCLNDEDCEPNTARCAYNPSYGYWACSNSQFLPP